MATIMLEYDARNAFAASMINVIRKSGVFKEKIVHPEPKLACSSKTKVCEAKLAIKDVKDGKLNSYCSPQALYEKLGI